MDKYEYRVKTEQMLEYMGQKSYGKAMEIADTVDWHRVKNAAMLCSVSEIYELNEVFDKSRDILFVAYDRAPGSRKIVYRLGILALKVGDTNEAMDCYEEFLTIAPKDPNQYILHYKILKAQQAPITQQIEALADFKKAEYIEKWAYELAKLYHEAGMTTECLEECDDLILWFSEGRYVYQAMELKMQYKPLTPSQQEKYNNRPEEGSQSKKNQFVRRARPQGEALAAKIAKAAAAGKTVAEEINQETQDLSGEQGQVEEFKEEPVLEVPVQEELVQEVLVEDEPAQEASENTLDHSTLKINVNDVVAAMASRTGKVAVSNETTPRGRDDSKQITGQMKIGEIIAGWHEKQQIRTPNIKIDPQPQEVQNQQEDSRKIEVPKQDKKAESPLLTDDIRALMQELEQRDAVEPNTAGDEELPEAEDINESAVYEETTEVEEDVELSIEELEEEEFLDEEYLDDDEIEDDETEEYEEYDDYDEDSEEAVDELDEEENYQDDYEESPAQALEAEKGPSRKAIAKAVATGKTAKLPIDEIAALTGSVPMDTGFIVQGRYDLDAQSEVGLRAGLTEEQKKLFSYFVPVRGMSEQLVDVLEQDKQCKGRQGTSRTGNLLIIGRKGSGKTVLAVDVVKAIQKQRNIKQGKVAIVTGESLNRKKVSEIINKLYGGALIIEKASSMNEKTIIRLNKAMERDTGELLIVLEEQRKPIDSLLASNKEFRRKFTSRLEVPIFINDELVTFGQTYAKENGYRIDEMGILALYSRIDLLQREDHAVTVAEVKDLMDEAVQHSQKGNMKKLVKRVFGKNTDDSHRIILTENDFNI